MQLDEVSFAIAVASFIGAILGAGLSNIVSSRIAGHERREARRKERFLHLVNIATDLINLRSQLQWLQGAGVHQEYKDREAAYGRAYAVMLSTADAEIVKKAEQVMLGAGHDGSKNEKLDAIDFAIRRVGELINQAMIEDEK